jgi:hypothetical protein
LLAPSSYSFLFFTETVTVFAVARTFFFNLLQLLLSFWVHLEQQLHIHRCHPPQLPAPLTNSLANQQAMVADVKWVIWNQA